MRRVILALLGLLCAAGLCMAQSWQARHQIGTATQEMTAEGLSAGHNKIPIGSKAKVTNPANGLEIEVTIVRQIPESPNRVIDLSPSAARALDIGSGGPVIVASLNQQNPSAPENSTGPSSEVEVQMGKQPFYITINNYIINPDKQVLPENKQESAPKDVELAALPAALPPAQPITQPSPAESPVSPPAQPVEQPAVQQAALPAAQPPEKASLYSSPPVYDPQIIPSLPNPNTNKVYRLLVGTYPSVESAFRIYQQLQTAGFDVVQEQAGDMCKVFAAGIPASRVYYAAKRLGAIGFPQIWIQE
jgi:rare lipoprotein A (peptidoglycan hydrolase)